jgi:hypothetical protein
MLPARRLFDRSKLLTSPQPPQRRAHVSTALPTAHTAQRGSWAAYRSPVAARKCDDNKPPVSVFLGHESTLRQQHTVTDTQEQSSSGWWRAPHSSTDCGMGKASAMSVTTHAAARTSAARASTSPLAARQRVYLCQDPAFCDSSTRARHPGGAATRSAVATYTNAVSDCRGGIAPVNLLLDSIRVLQHRHTACVKRGARFNLVCTRTQRTRGRRTQTARLECPP